MRKPRHPSEIPAQAGRIEKPRGVVLLIGPEKVIIW